MPDRQTVTVGGVGVFEKVGDSWYHEGAPQHPEKRYYLNTILAEKQRREQAEADVRFLLTLAPKCPFYYSDRVGLDSVRARYPQEEADPA